MEKKNPKTRNISGGFSNCALVNRSSNSFIRTMAEGEGETVSVAPDYPGPILPRYLVFPGIMY